MKLFNVFNRFDSKFVFFICLFTSLFSFYSAQLFDVINKENANKNEIYNKHKDSSLFDNINFNQISEKAKKIKSEESSIFSELNANKKIIENVHKNVVPNNIHDSQHNPHNANINKLKSHTIASNNSKRDSIISKPVDLKNKASVLIKMNSKLNKQINKKRKLNKKHKKIGKEIVSFIQKNEKNVNEMNKKIENKNEFIANKIKNKELEIKKLFENTKNKFKILKSSLSKINLKMKKYEENNSHPSTNMNNLKENMELNSFKINKKLDVDGEANIDKTMFTHSIELGGLKIDSENLTFYNRNLQFIFGNEVVNLEKILKNIQLIENLNKKCGSDLSKCKIMKKDVIIENTKKQEKILKDLKTIRLEMENM